MKNTHLNICLGFVLFFLVGIHDSMAGFQFQHDILYYSTTDNVENGKFNTMRNSSFLGASLGINDKFAIGQSLVYWSMDQQTGSGTTKMSMLDLGPRFIYYFGSEHYTLISASYHPYAKGTRTITSSSTSSSSSGSSSSSKAGGKEEISGSSLLLSFTCQLKISKKAFIGASLNYYNLKLKESTTGTVTSNISQSYSTVYPTINFSFRFK